MSYTRTMFKFAMLRFLSGKPTKSHFGNSLSRTVCSDNIEFWILSVECWVFVECFLFTGNRPGTLNSSTPLLCQVRKMGILSPKQISPIKIEQLCRILTLSTPRISSRILLSLFANYSGKSSQHETAETAKPWVDTCLVGKFRLFLRASGTPW